MQVTCALVALLAIAQPPSQKTTLPNGAMVYVERMEGAVGFTAHLFVSAWGRPEPEGQRGWRHLLEHLVAKGKDRNLDARLESQGLTLTADTLPDGIRFEVEGSAGTERAAVEAMRDLLAFTKPTEEEVAHEVGIIGHEGAVRTYSARISAALRKHAFAGQTDPFGDAADLAKATPNAIAALHEELFRPDSMTVVVVGDIDQRATMEAVGSVFGGLQSKGRPTRAGLSAVVQKEEGFVRGTPGCGRGVVVESMGRSETLAVIAAGLVLASEVQEARLVYTPSAIGGVVSLTHPSRKGLDGLDAVITDATARHFTAGVRGIRLWAETADAATREKARMYGQMLMVEPYFRMEDLKTRVGQITQADVMAAMRKFHSGQCVRVGGVR